MRSVLGAVLALAGAMSVAAAQEHRELGPHVHGTSSLNIAIEGGTLSVDLDAPGMDIVGFEHEASTPEQRAAIDAAVKALGDPVALFGFPATAGCTVASAEAGPEEHEHEEVPAPAGVAPAAEEAHHSDFAGAYRLSCATPAALTALDLTGYFSSFSGAEHVNLQLVSDTVQMSKQVDRANPKLSISGQP